MSNLWWLSRCDLLSRQSHFLILTNDLQVSEDCAFAHPERIDQFALGVVVYECVFSQLFPILSFKVALPSGVLCHCLSCLLHSSWHSILGQIHCISDWRKSCDWPTICFARYCQCWITVCSCFKIVPFGRGRVGWLSALAEADYHVLLRVCTLTTPLKTATIHCQPLHFSLFACAWQCLSG